MMNDRPESAEQYAPLKGLQERVARNDLSGVKVTLRLSGGVPGENRIVEELRFSGDRLEIAQREALGKDSYSVELPPAQVQDLIRDLAFAAEELLQLRPARFLPDSLVGAVVIEVDGQSITLFYHADPQSGTTSNRSDRLNDVINRFERLLWDTEGSVG
jgi:hypothetical protein